MHLGIRGLKTHLEARAVPDQPCNLPPHQLLLRPLVLPCARCLPVARHPSLSTVTPQREREREREQGAPTPHQSVPLKLESSVGERDSGRVIARRNMKVASSIQVVEVESSYGRPQNAVSPETNGNHGKQQLTPKTYQLRGSPLDYAHAHVPAPCGDNDSEALIARLSEAGALEGHDVQSSVQTLLSVWRGLPSGTRDHLKKVLDESYSALIATQEPLEGSNVAAEPVPRAPENVFIFRDEETRKPLGWRNVFDLPIKYDVELVDGLLEPSNSVLARRLLPEGGHQRRFLVVDQSVHELYGGEIANYFEQNNMEMKCVVLPGEECNKRWEAVDAILDQLCVFGLHRREPIIGIGGGVLLDIVGLAANLYRRGVPYIRVPTTLLAIVDASVGVKNGIDYCSCSMGPQKNRVGSFYAPAGAFLDKRFIATQDTRNIVNGLGEIMKLALVRSPELFELLEVHGPRLVRERFQGCDGAADRVIELSIQIMLEELGPNLWETKLERCVDYGHTFSKIIEMEEGADIMHGEAVNVDGFLCIIIAQKRGMISSALKQRIFDCMSAIGLPTSHRSVTPEKMYKGLLDAVEHRHGKQRIPLITGVGSSQCVNDITMKELEQACAELWEIHQ